MFSLRQNKEWSPPLAQGHLSSTQHHVGGMGRSLIDSTKCQVPRSHRCIRHLVFRQPKWHRQSLLHGLWVHTSSLCSRWQILEGTIFIRNNSFFYIPIILSSFQFIYVCVMFQCILQQCTFLSINFTIFSFQKRESRVRLFIDRDDGDEANAKKAKISDYDPSEWNTLRIHISHLYNKMHLVTLQPQLQHFL